MLSLLSANHKTTEFATLERLSASGSLTSSSVVATHRDVRGAVVVATCNRFEVYLDLGTGSEVSSVFAVASVVELIADAAGMSAAELREDLTFLSSAAAVAHLFAVASGLESVVVGEDEISGQVKRALDDAERAGASTAALSTLFQRALEASRTVKGASEVRTTGRSIVGVALDLAESRLRDWSEARVLVIGTGRYATTTVGSLRSRGAMDIRAYSASQGGARFSAMHDVPLVAAADLSREATLADLIIACTNAHEYVLDARHLRIVPADASEAGRRTLRLASVADAAPPQRIVIDLGLPRNVNPNVGKVRGTTIVDLETIRVHASADVHAGVSSALEVVADATARFSSAERLREVAPALEALRSYVFDLVDNEVERAGKGAAQERAVEEALRHFAGVLLHEPMSRARQHAQRGDVSPWLDGLHAVLGIEAPDAAPASEAHGDGTTGSEEAETA